MKLYLLSQTENNGYDTHDSMVVAARNEDDARMIHPRDESFPDRDNWADDLYSSWASSPKRVKVEHIGQAKPHTARGIILASFNAG